MNARFLKGGRGSGAKKGFDLGTKQYQVNFSTQNYEEDYDFSQVPGYREQLHRVEHMLTVTCLEASGEGDEGPDGTEDGDETISGDDGSGGVSDGVGSGDEGGTAPGNAEGVTSGGDEASNDAQTAGAEASADTPGTFDVGVSAAAGIAALAFTLVAGATAFLRRQRG